MSYSKMIVRGFVNRAPEWRSQRKQWRKHISDDVKDDLRLAA